jgi:hypothetical protein
MGEQRLRGWIAATAIIAAVAAWASAAGAAAWP